MSPSKKINLIIWILADLAVLGLASWLVFSTLNSDARLEEKSNQVKMMTTREEELNILERTAQETASDRAKLDSFFVDSRDVTGFLDSLESLGEKINVKLEVRAINDSANLPAKTTKEPAKTTNEPAKQTSAFPTLKVSFRSEGEFAGLFRLIELLEQVPYELKINKIMFSFGTGSAVEEAGSDWTGDFEVELLSFVSNPVK